MKQLICYLYEYEHNKQIKNVGFLKCIFQKNKVTFQIHGKGLACDKFMDLEMFLFVSDGGDCKFDRASTVEGNHGQVNYKVTIDDMDEKRFQEYDGILLESQTHKQYVAMWNQKNILLGKTMKDLEEQGDKEVDFVEIEDVERVLVDEYEEELEGEEIDEETLRIEEAFQETVKVEIEEQLDEIDENIYVHLKYEKIQRQGIAGLPQREWKLANNNFLVHGYSNYNHLMLIRENQQLYLGVPGIYHNKEAAAAKSFGFPLFHEINEKEREVLELEHDTEETFGYWCRPVSERRRMDMRYGRGENAS